MASPYARSIDRRRLFGGERNRIGGGVTSLASIEGGASLACASSQGSIHVFRTEGGRKVLLSAFLSVFEFYVATFKK